MKTSSLISAFLLLAAPAAAVEGSYPALPAPAAFLSAAGEEAVPEVGAAQQTGFSLPPLSRLYEDARAVGVLGTKLTITDGAGARYGHLKTVFWDLERWTSKTLGITPRMDVELWSPDEKTLVAHADADLVSYAYTVHVEDGNGEDLGSFKSDLWVEVANDFSDIAKGELTRYASFYGIFDSEGTLIARSVKSQDATGAVFYIQRAVYADGELTGYDLSGPVASISSNNGWNIQLLQPDFVQAGPGKLDPRVLVMIPAYKNFVGKAKLKRESGR